MMKRIDFTKGKIQWTLLLTLLCSTAAYSADNLLIVSIDGLRWQELYRGYQQSLVQHDDFTQQAAGLEQDFGGDNAQQKRQKLMPFIWDTLAKKGVLLGNRDQQSAMQVTNDWWFSYPGYNEILTGHADPRIDSNEPVANPNVSFLEWLHNQSAYKGKVAAFGSWDVFPAILNAKRSELPVNAGFMPADWQNLSVKSQWLNDLQDDVPSPWHNVRLDAFTVGLAQEYVNATQPKVLYVAFGETDDFGHDGDYPAYLRAAHRTDKFISRLWQQLQSMEQYRDNTNLVITVDHGRGNDDETWQHHASLKATQGYLNNLSKHPQGIIGSNEIWMAAMGPDVKPAGEASNTPLYELNQIAATALLLLGQSPEAFAKDTESEIGQAVPIMKLNNE
ncbi:MAG: hypothetical protein ACJA13_003532 [Paraglaciecola sp.]|jgi:hypothetical protein